MKHLAWLLVVLPFAEAVAHQRLTVTFRYRGQRMYASFFSNIRPFEGDEQSFREDADLLEGLRQLNYMDRHAGRETPEQHQAKRDDLIQGFFRHEPLHAHDEVVVLHRDAMQSNGTGRSRLEEQEVLGMIAVDRLGDVFLDQLPSPPQSYETLLLEKRLAPLGLTIPRPTPASWFSPELPPGVQPHWDPYIRQHFFQQGRIFYGDVIQANALFAHEGLWPLLHSLANHYGVFSTGRIVAGKPKNFGSLTIQGPAVFIPTLVVWEVFNPPGGVGSRTRYYQNSGTHALTIDGYDQWRDPRLRQESYVQIAYKTGSEFREGWTRHFAKKENFDWVRDVVIDTEVLERMPNGQRIVQNLRSYAGPSLGSCIDALLDEQREIIHVSMPLTISVQLGNTTPVQVTYLLYYSGLPPRRTNP